MKIKILSVIIAFVVFNVNSYTAEITTDSVKTYRIGEVSVTGIKNPAKIQLSKYDVKYYEIQRSDAASLNQIQLYIPSARIRINSRGESMLFIRGAGERQLGLFFDGVQMNIPWDNRFDLTFIPTDVIGQIGVNKNANSILYGPNVLGGAVNISTFEKANEGYGLSVRLQADNSSTYNTSVTHDGKLGNFNYIANLSYLDSKGSLLSGNAPDTLLNQDIKNDYITNTDVKRIASYIRGEYKFSELTTLGLSVSYISGEKGVAPENHNDNPRFWRYPELNRTLATLNFEQYLSEEMDMVIRATVWYDIFNQTIEDYKNISYNKSEMNQVQKDNDVTIGTRIAYQYLLNDNHNFTYVFNGFTSKHKETISDELHYSQNTINTGLEYNGNYNLLNVNFGIGYDYNETPETGLFKQYEGLSSSDYAAFLNLNYKIDEKMGLFGNLSRRTRFATMRESYSGALNKFKVNPELKPETGILGEFGLYLDQNYFNLKISGFINSYTDMITQITLSKDVDSLKRKMRINVGKATLYGIDLSFRSNPFSTFYLDGSFTYMLSNGEDASGNDIEHFDNKPEIIAGLSAYYKTDFNLDVLAELEYTGRQWETDKSLPGGFAEISGCAALNLRISYLFTQINGIISEIFVRGNNIFDAYRLSQRGIPEPGRTIQAGIKVNI